MYLLDPFKPSFLGMEIHIAKKYPRYVLPKEVIPDVPWPQGFREEIHNWSISFLGEVCEIPQNAAYVLYGNKVIMSQEMFAAFRQLARG